MVYVLRGSRRLWGVWHSQPGALTSNARYRVSPQGSGVEQEVTSEKGHPWGRLSWPGSDASWCLLDPVDEKVIFIQFAQSLVLGLQMVLMLHRRGLNNRESLSETPTGPVMISRGKSPWPSPLSSTCSTPFQTESRPQVHGFHRWWYLLRT